MKKGLLYIVLLTYSSMMFKPVLPYMADMIAHTLYYKAHMATVHFENGKLHVHKEILKETTKEQQTGKTQQLKKDNQPNDHINITIASAALPLRPQVNYCSYHSSSCPLTCIPVFTPPPRILA